MIKKIFMKSLKQLGMIGLAYCLLGCSPVKEPSPDSYATHAGSTLTHGRIIDYNNDGIADAILDSTGRDIQWFAEDNKISFQRDLTSRSLPMTPEMREMATSILTLQRKLEYSLDKEKYRLEQEKKTLK